MLPDPASVKAETHHAASDSGLPGQFGLPARLTADMFEEVAIDLAGGAAIGLRRWPRAAGWAGSPGRAAWWRIVPQTTVSEDLADNLALMGLDDGDDFHGAAALGATQRVGLVDAFDEHGPRRRSRRTGSGMSGVWSFPPG